MDLEVEDIPLSFTVILVLLGVLLQLMFWLPDVFSALVPGTTLVALSPFILLTSLVLFTVSGWRFAIAIRERLDTRGNYNRYISAQLDQLENRLVNVEKSLAGFQRRVLSDVEALKLAVSNVSCQLKVKVLEKPSKEELEKLKVTLGVEGSLQRKGRTIYHVQYDSQAKKHNWRRLGSWSDLKQKLHQKISSN